MTDSKERMKKFEAALDNITNGAFVGHAIVLGTKLGLFKLLNEFSSEKEPKTSVQIAEKANMKERYVREWLNCMVAAKLVECDADVKHYWMLDGAMEKVEAGGLMVFLPFLLEDLSDISPVIAACFAKDGPRGTKYSQYPNFHGAMDTFSAAFAGDLVSKYLPALLAEYNIVDLLSKGSNVSILDIGCSNGAAVRAMGLGFPNAQVYGLDYDASAIESAKKMHSDVKNTNFVFGDAAKMVEDHPDWADKFDLITDFDALHDLSRPDLMLKAIPKILKPGGVFMCADVNGTSNAAQDRDTNPIAAAVYTISLFHCMPVSLNYEDGLGYGAAWGVKTAKALMEECGLKEVKVKTPEGDFNAYFIWQKPKM